MQLKSLRLLIDVADTGSFVAAADLRTYGSIDCHRSRKEAGKRTGCAALS